MKGQKRAQINLQHWHVPDIVPCIRHSQSTTKFCGAQACHFQQAHHEPKEQDGQANESTSFPQCFCTKFAFRKVRWVHVDLQQILSDDTLMKPMTVNVHNDVSLVKERSGSRWPRGHTMCKDRHITTLHCKNKKPGTLL